MDFDGKQAAVLAAGRAGAACRAALRSRAAAALAAADGAPLRALALALPYVDAEDLVAVTRCAAGLRGLAEIEDAWRGLFDRFGEQQRARLRRVFCGRRLGADEADALILAMRRSSAS